MPQGDPVTGPVVTAADAPEISRHKNDEQTDGQKVVKGHALQGIHDLVHFNMVANLTPRTKKRVGDGS